MTVIESALTMEEQQVNDLVTELLENFPPKATDAVTFLGADIVRLTGFAAPEMSPAKFAKAKLEPAAAVS